MSTCQALDEMIATTLGGPPEEQWAAISTASHDLRRAGRVLHAGSLLPKNVTCHVSRSTDDPDDNPEDYQPEPETEALSGEIRASLERKAGAAT